ncbi:MAG TPA: hypothetical protein ENN69_06605 [Spirochaetia bacterium]|nr:hypothetical protein [Spirochaetia bacterium]
MKQNGSCFNEKVKYLIISSLLITAGLFLAGCRQETDPPIRRVGILYESSTLIAAAEGFKEKMAELGYVDGKGVLYYMRQSDASPELNRKNAEELVKANVDLIFAFPLNAALAAKAATRGTDIPVIFTYAGLEGNDLVKSVREPGDNITGVRSPITELTVKSFDIMHALIPRMKRLYVPYAANYPTILPALGALREAAEIQGVMVVAVPVSSLEELAADLAVRGAGTVVPFDAIQLLPETLVQSPDGLKMLTLFADRRKIPISAITPWAIHAGAVFVSGLDPREMGLLAAPLADKALKGIRAGTIPVVSPEMHLRINYRQALKIGLSVPEGLLLRADEIIR